MVLSKNMRWKLKYVKTATKKSVDVLGAVQEWTPRRPRWLSHRALVLIEGSSGMAVATQGSSAAAGPVPNARDQVARQEGLSPVLVWITQSPEAKAKQELPGWPLLLEVPLRKAALGRPCLPLKGKCMQSQLHRQSPFLSGCGQVFPGLRLLQGQALGKAGL